MDKQQIPAGYKQTEVGVIPADWDVSLLKNLTVDMLQGVNTAIDIPEYVESGIPMLKANNVIDQVVKFKGADSISAKTFLSYSDRFRLRKNDFLFSNIGARLGTGSLLEVDIDCSFAWNVMRIVPDQKKVIPKFLAYQINSSKNSEKIKSEQSGSGMGFIPKSTMQKVLLAVPSSLKEQTAIANALSDVDALIAALEKLIDKKTAIKTATMQQLLTGKKRLPPFDQLDVGYKQTELGEIPKDWEVDKIGNVLSITTGGRNTQDKVSDGLYPFYVRSQTVERINSYSFDGEGILTAGDGVGTGKIFHYINGKCDIHQRVYLMHNFSNKLHGYYFYIYFKNNFYDKVMSMTAKSSVDSVRREMIADMLIVLPSVEEQKAISNVLSEMDTELDALQQSLAKTQHIKQGMMQELLTGKTRLI